MMVSSLATLCSINFVEGYDFWTKFLILVLLIIIFAISAVMYRFLEDPQYYSYLINSKRYASIHALYNFLLIMFVGTNASEYFKNRYSKHEIWEIFYLEGLDLYDQRYMY